MINHTIRKHQKVYLSAFDERTSPPFGQTGVAFLLFNVSPSANPTVLLGSGQPTGRSCFLWRIVRRVLSFFRLVVTAIPPRHPHTHHHGIDGLIFNEDISQRPAIAILATTLDGGSLSKGNG